MRHLPVAAVVSTALAIAAPRAQTQIPSPHLAPSAARAVQTAPIGPVTFTKDVAPIIFDRCGMCHHPDGTAPFSLLTYDAVRQRAIQIAAVTKAASCPRGQSVRKGRELRFRA